MNLDYPDLPEQMGGRHLQGLRRAFPVGRPLPVDAIFCFNDVGAMFVLRELQDRGIAVPDDVAVVGFNDIEPARTCRPALASGDRKGHRLAATVDDLVHRRLEDPDLPPQQHTVHMEFVPRESAG